MNNNYNTTPVAYATAVPVKAPTKQDSLYSLPDTSQMNHVKALDVHQQLQALKEQGYPTGLAHSLTRMMQEFPLRIWVVDNSGSMASPDGNRLIPLAGHNLKVAQCTRWVEIQECVKYHINVANLLNAATTFRMLNSGSTSGKQQFSICNTSDPSNTDVSSALSVINNARPNGVTPLTMHIMEIQHHVTQMLPHLKSTGQRVAIVIATDGLPSDEAGYSNHETRQEFIGALRLLEGLPVWVVIRLCTDEDDVVEFYNDIDEQLELSLEVLDDFHAEAAEIYEHNPWINYTLPMHRCREMGYHLRVFDMLDERALTKDEMAEFCSVIFGEYWDGMPDPHADWDGFMHKLKGILKKEKEMYNPMKKRPTPLVDLKKINKEYGDNEGCIIS